MYNFEDDFDFPIGNGNNTDTALVTTKTYSEVKATIEPNSTFSYDEFDSNTAEFLKVKELEIKEIVFKSATEIGKRFKEAQEKLAGSNQYNGFFQKWYESFGYAKRTVYNLINRYDLLVQNLHEQDFLESLPLSTTYELAKLENSVPVVQVMQELDITKHSDYKQLIQRLKNSENIINSKEKEIEKLSAKAKAIGHIADEKEEMLRSKDNMIKTLLSRKPEIKEVYKENPALEVQISEMRNKNQETINQLLVLTDQLQEYQKYEGKQKEIELIYSQIEELKVKKSSMIKNLNELNELFKFIEKTKEFIKEEMLQIATLVTPPKEDTEVVKQEFQIIIEVVENWIFAIKQKFLAE